MSFDLRDTEEQRGTLELARTLHEVSTDYADAWRNLPRERKAEYERMAEEILEKARRLA